MPTFASRSTLAMDLVPLYKILNSTMDQVRLLVAEPPASGQRVTRKELRSIEKAQEGIKVVMMEEQPPEWDVVCSGLGGKAAAERLLSQQASSLASYTALLAVATTRIKQLDAYVVSTNVLLEEFSVLWDIINTTGQLQLQWPTAWPEEALIGNLPMYAALDDFIAWFLAFTRGSSHTCGCAQRNLGYLEMQVRLREGKAPSGLFLGVSFGVLFGVF